MPISAVTEVTPAFGDAGHGPDQHVISDSNAGGDSAGQKSAGAKRKARSKDAEDELPHAGHSPAEPGKGETIDVSG